MYKSYEFFVEFQDKKQEKKIDDVFAKIRRLSIQLVKEKERAKNEYKNLIKNEYPELIKKELNHMKELGLYPPNIKLNEMPFCSFLLNIDLQLRSFYLSKDEDEFYTCDNPICKDYVFKVPMIRASSWKGNLHWVAVMLLANKTNPSAKEFAKERLKIACLFGSERGVDIFSERLESYLSKIYPEAHAIYINLLKEKSNTGSFSGRLKFFPTFWDNIGLDIINPHDRKSRTGKVPIWLEGVPPKAKGIFTLLYVPFDLIGLDKEKIKHEVKEDLKLVIKLIKEMMLNFGFSAKKGSGYGVINPEISGELLTNAPVLIDGKDKIVFTDLEWLINEIQ